MLTRPKIDIICVNYFSSNLVEAMLNCLVRSDYRKIIIVDNSASELEHERLSVVAHTRDVTVVKMTENVGFGAAVNRGAECAEIDEESFLWILNPDTLPSPGAGLELVRIMREASLDMASPLILTGKSGRTIWFAGGSFDASAGRTSHFLVPDMSSPLTFVTAAALMLSGRAWAKLGGFREDLFMYWEDADLSIRANSLGLSIGLAPDVEVWHAVGATSSDVGRSRLFHYYMQRNRLVVLREHFGNLYLFNLRRIAEALKLLLRAMREDEAAVGKSVASVRGYVDGMWHGAGHKPTYGLSSRGSSQVAATEKVEHD